MGEVVISGIGLVTALAGDREGTWRRLVAGESAIGPLTLFDTTGFRTSIAAQVDVAALGGWPGGEPRRLGRTSRMALAASAEALADAGLPLVAEAHTWPLVLGGGAAGLFEAEEFLCDRLRHGPRVTGAHRIIESPQDSSADRVATAFGLIGPRITITTACSSATIAIGMAAEMIAAGQASVAVAGGADGLCRLTYAGFNSLRAVDTQPCRPFDVRRRGLSFGEGAGILVLEDAEHARRRGAQAYATVLGYGVTNDAVHMTQPEPGGIPWERTIAAALRDSGVTTADVDYINAHATATEQNDAAECAAYRRVFGARLADVPVTSVKGAVGHCLCASGAVEAGITALAVARQMAPPTAGFSEADPACPVDPVPGRGRALAIRVALSSSFAFGGNSAVVVLGRAA